MGSAGTGLNIGGQYQHSQYEIDGSSNRGHIPWPELLKDHETTLNAHLETMVAVHKQCPQGTADCTVAQACVIRTQEMLRDFHHIRSKFIPSLNNIGQIPLDAATASTQSPRRPAETVPDQDFRPDQNNTSDNTEKPAQATESERQQERVKTANRVVPKQHTESVKQGSGPTTDNLSALFTIDTTPTPVSVLIASNTETKPKSMAKPNDSAKRRLSFSEETSTGGRDSVAKRAKTQVDRAQVEMERKTLARVKAKELRRKKKESKKRKRESNASDQYDIVFEPNTQKPEKKKARKNPVKKAKSPATGPKENNKTKKAKKRASLEGGQNETLEPNENPKKKRRKDG